MTLRDLSEKDVIQLKTGENLGRIDDLAFEDGHSLGRCQNHRDRCYHGGCRSAAPARKSHQKRLDVKSLKNLLDRGEHFVRLCYNTLKE